MHILSFFHITQNFQAVSFCDAKILNWHFPPLKKIPIWRVPDPLRIRQKIADVITRTNCRNLAKFLVNFRKKHKCIYSYTLKKTYNAPFIILSISSMIIILATWNLQYIKFKAFKGIFLININLTFFKKINF